MKHGTMPRRLTKQLLFTIALTDETDVENIFFSVSWCILLRYEDNFSLKKCSGESVEEKVAGNVKENWKIGNQNLFWNSMTSGFRNWDFSKTLNFLLVLWLWKFLIMPRTFFLARISIQNPKNTKKFTKFWHFIK